MPYIRSLITAIFLSLCLTACGQKGDLYLPGEKAAIQQNDNGYQTIYQIC